MKMDDARILVIGAGVNGSVCAAGLQRAGANVTVLARGQRYAELAEDGIVIENPIKNTRSVTKVPVISGLTPEDRYDYILVIVRKNQVPELLPVLARNCSPNIVFMVNNPSGPEVYTAALGRERVMLGLVFAGGKRDGSVIRAIGGPGEAVGAPPFGELDGSKSPRLKRLVSLFRQAGFKVKTSNCMADYLATHAAMVAPLARLLINNGSDTYALARSRADLRLCVEAMREVPAVLRRNGFRVVPAENAIVFAVVPKFLLVAFMRRFMATRLAEVGAAWHCQQAPDEMQQLGVELMALVQKSGLPAPALRQVFADVDGGIRAGRSSR
jgi:2-dehydropantoate 2-reductase